MAIAHVIALSLHRTEVYKITFAFDLVNFVSSLLHKTSESRIIKCLRLEPHHTIWLGSFKLLSVYYSISSSISALSHSVT